MMRVWLIALLVMIGAILLHFDSELGGALVLGWALLAIGRALQRDFNGRY